MLYRYRVLPLLAAVAVAHLGRCTGAIKVAPRHCGGTVRHVHLSVGPDPSTQMIVTFASIPSNFPAPVGGVLVGTSPSQLSQVVIEEEEGSAYNVPANTGHGNYGRKYYSPYYHHVTISNLKPSTTYYYRPVIHASVKGFDRHNFRTSSNQEGMTKDEIERSIEEALKASQQDEKDEEDDRRRLIMAPYNGSDKECPSPDKIRSFRTAPAPGADASVSLAFMGDLGQFPHSEETMLRLIRSKSEIDAVILAGDIGYTGEDHRRWDTFFDFFDDFPLAESVPMQICPGNHDIDKIADHDGIFLAYENRFRMPRIKPAVLGVYDGPEGHLNMDQPPYPLPYEYGNAYYSFIYGPAKMIMVSSYSSMDPGSIQHNWLVDQLQSVDRSVTPWVLLTLHTPIYNTFSLHQKDLQIVAARKHIEPLLIEHKVNLVFSGHIHAYLRTGNVAFGKVTPSGPMHITVGAGGRKCEAPFLSAEPEPWVEVRDSTFFGYGMFHISNRTHAEWNWVHTGENEDRDYNQVWRSDEQLPAGPSRDSVDIPNQYFL
jgi:hypothetical protein